MTVLILEEGKVEVIGPCHLLQRGGDPGELVPQVSPLAGGEFVDGFKHGGAQPAWSCPPGSDCDSGPAARPRSRPGSDSGCRSRARTESAIRRGRAACLNHKGHSPSVTWVQRADGRRDAAVPAVPWSAMRFDARNRSIRCALTPPGASGRGRRYRSARKRGQQALPEPRAGRITEMKLSLRSCGRIAESAGGRSPPSLGAATTRSSIRLTPSHSLDPSNC
jgi:hypothetical protein